MQQFVEQCNSVVSPGREKVRHSALLLCSLKKQVIFSVSSNEYLLIPGQRHENAPGVLMHVPPLWQGLLSRHSSTSTVQNFPTNPRHLQDKPCNPMSHTPPLWHGLGSHDTSNSRWNLLGGRNFDFSRVDVSFWDELKKMRTPITVHWIKIMIVSSVMHIDFLEETSAKNQFWNHVQCFWKILSTVFSPC